MTDPGGSSGLNHWLASPLEVLGCKARRTKAPLLLWGLLSPAERRRLQLVTARLSLVAVTLGRHQKN
jgi:hypothetical protein